MKKFLFVLNPLLTTFFVSYITLFFSIFSFPENYLCITLKIVLVIFFAFFYIFSKKTNNESKLLLIVTAFWIFVLADFVTKRMAFWYLHQIPMEIISIALDTNIDEVRSVIHFKESEYYLIFNIVLNLILWGCYLFIYKPKEDTRSHSKMKSYGIFIFLMFSLLLLFSPLRIMTTELIKAVPEIRSNYQNILLKKEFKWGATDQNRSDESVVILFLGETHRGDHLLMWDTKNGPLGLVEKGLKSSTF